ncbi:OmpA family protein [Thaumasiovibrio subtropicus]|uniref:OmpA family protein n=1 Tax=Thaumasiovibrio subtropicus TaxID=1891207 RepID=UPI000B351794|nr:OmpA family protein [Thaumasiovibrio subtropicus]
MKKLVLAAVIAAVTATGCTTTNPYTGEQQTAKATTGSVIGAVAGAAVGAASSSRGDRKKGILIGAASGAAVGGGIGYYMDVQEAKLREQLAASGITVIRDGDNIILNMPNEITFRVNETNLDSRARLALRNVALVVNEYDQTMLNVLGHTDSTGSAAYNQELSQRRANEVRSQLIAEGVSPSRVVAIGRGESSPIANNNTEQGRAENRRVEIVLSPIAQ